MRQHVNPLSRYFQSARTLPSLEELFERPDLPIHLDIGSARGKFLLDMARFQSDWNHLGVEIRHPLVIAANREREELGLTNLQFLFCNANISLEGWLSTLQKGKLQRVSIQFPDPWFKRRHWKRRVFQPSLIASLLKAMPLSSELFLQSDLLQVIEPMAKLVEFSNGFTPIEAAGLTWLETNPLPVVTERERYVNDRGLPIYRLLYRRNTNVPLDLSTLEEKWQMVHDS